MTYPQPKPPGDQNKAMFGQQADYDTEKWMEDRLAELDQAINMLVYTGAEEADPQTRALADTITLRMRFFVLKQRQVKNPDVSHYDKAIKDLRATRRPKKIRQIMNEVSGHFANDAKIDGFSATKARKKLPGTDFLLHRLQLTLTPEEKAFLDGIKGFFKKMCFIFAAQLVHGGDVPLLMTGAPGFGKGSNSIRICRRVTYYLKEGYYKFDDVEVPPWDMNKDILWAGHAREELNKYYGKARFNRKIIDDAYMDALNLESNQGKAIFIGKTINVTRSKNNLTIFCYQVPTRATSFLLEAFYLWAHKYQQPRMIFLARTKIFTVKDMWGIGKLLKSENENQIISRLANNTNKVKIMRPKKLPDSDFKAYETIKHDEQEKFRIMNETKEIMNSALDRYAIEVREAVRQKLLTDNDYDVEMYIRKKYPGYSYTKRNIKSIIKRYRELDFALVSAAEQKANQ